MKLKKIILVLLSAVMLPSFAVAGCGKQVNPDASAATLDGKEISMGIANFMAQYQAAMMDSSLLGYYGEDMWEKDSGDGKTMTESMKESVMEDLQEYYLLDAHAADYEVALTDEEKQAITAAATQFMSDNSSTAAGAMGATQETVEEMLRLRKIQSKVRAAIEAQIDTNVSDEECAQKTFSYVMFDKAPSANTSTDDTQTDESDTEKTEDAQVQAKEKAEAFVTAAADDLNAAAEASSYTVQTCSYGSGDLEEDGNTTGMDQAVLKAADKLKDGELADKIAETDSAYYVIRMDSTDDKTAAGTKKESILSQRRTEKYNEVLDGYKEKCKWEINEDEWDKVNFDELYTVKQPETTADDGSAEGAAADTSGNTTADTANTTTDQANTTADPANTTADTTDPANTTADTAGTETTADTPNTTAE